jgi:hypothetical protein
MRSVDLKSSKRREKVGDYLPTNEPCKELKRRNHLLLTAQMAGLMIRIFAIDLRSTAIDAEQSDEAQYALEPSSSQIGPSFLVAHFLT